MMMMSSHTSLVSRPCLRADEGDDEDEDGDDDDADEEDAGGGWDMWQSPSILDYSLAALRGPP